MLLHLILILCHPYSSWTKLDKAFLTKNKIVKSSPFSSSFPTIMRIKCLQFMHQHRWENVVLKFRELATSEPGLSWPWSCSSVLSILCSIADSLQVTALRALRICELVLSSTFLSPEVAGVLKVLSICILHLLPTGLVCSPPPYIWSNERVLAY